MSGPDAVTLADVRAAAGTLDGVAIRTPVLGLPGTEVRLKLESLQRTGAFKFRGAYNLVASLDPATRSRGVVTASSGNHAQALALAAALHGIPATVFMPRDAPAVKRAGAEELGAHVVEFERLTDDRDALVAAWASRTGAAVVPAYDDPRIVAGAGTAALELLEDAGDLEAVVIPTSGGGSLAGWSVVLDALAPHVQVFGACPEASDAPRRSLAAGRRERVAVGATLADGLQVATPGAVNFALYAGRVTDIVTVGDEEVLGAMRVLAARAKQVVEPSGAVALAAVLSGRLPLEGRRVGVMVSGGNVDPAVLARAVTGRDPEPAGAGPRSP
jgi:threonine dehydratase